MAIFALLFVLMVFAGASVIKAQGSKLVRSPDIVNSLSSWNMELLRGHLNYNQNLPLSNELAIVDNSALVAETPLVGDGFAELGVAGAGQISTYIVRKGDTLSTIARMYGVSVNTIAWANEIKGSKITPGQTLVILPISGVRHTVVKGDTIQSIAKKYNADVPDILAYNGFTSDVKLSVGDEVIVPDGEIKSVVSASSYSSSNITVASGYYMRPVDGGRKTQGIHGHNGVDLGGLSVGTPVMAAADGTVIIARTSGYNGGYGLYIVVSHKNGTQTLYGHLSTVNVSLGQVVEKGEVIGKLGNSGKSTGPHLHFEVRGARNPF